MASALDSRGASCPGLNPGREYTVVFLGKTLRCQCVSCA